MKIGSSAYSNAVAVVGNLLLAYLVYMLSRVAYVWENWALLQQGWANLSLNDLLAGSLRFDSSAIFYTNALYIVLMLLPLHHKERRWYHSMCKTIFVVINTLAVSINLIDAVYSQYSGRRTTWSFFQEFENEGNLGDIFFIEVLHHWYLFLVGVAFLLMLIFLYIKPQSPTSRTSSSQMPPPKNLLPYYIINSIAIIVFVPITICAMRGGASTAIRPITISNANQYVNQPQEAAIVLNTPFSLIRTANKKTFVNPNYMSEEQAMALYSPIHEPDSSDTMRRKNVVVLIVESFAREHSAFYNPTLEDGNYEGYTPFLDSLLEHSLTYNYTFANGRKSIDGMPSILSSIPMFEEPFILTSSSLNDIGGIAHSLVQEGYTTAFYHGAENGSMGFQAFARTSGFQHYFGRTEYNQDTRFGGDKDFDGTWAIWDEPFLQYYALSMSELKEPFMTALFTASSHHPFALPKQYIDTFAEGPHPIHKCIRYTDHSLRRFFATASQQSWYKNTIFVLTADHTNAATHDYYLTPLGLYSVPLLFFDPSGELQRGNIEGIAQQIDIMPTLLSILHYPHPYLAFGKDLLAADNTEQWAIMYNNGVYQYVEGDYLLLVNGTQPTSLFNINLDPMQQNNILADNPTISMAMTERCKAIIQQYMVRMSNNQLLAESNKRENK